MKWFKWIIRYRANVHDSRVQTNDINKVRMSYFGSTVINYETKSPLDIRFIKIDRKMVNLIEEYHLNLRKGCGDMKIHDMTLTLVYI